MKSLGSGPTDLGGNEGYTALLALKSKLFDHFTSLTFFFYGTVRAWEIITVSLWNLKIWFLKVIFNWMGTMFQSQGQVLTDSWKHSFLSSISRSVWRTLIHSFSSLSMSFLVCLISLTGWQETCSIIYSHVLLMQSLAQKQGNTLLITTRWNFLGGQTRAAE